MSIIFEVFSFKQLPPKQRLLKRLYQASCEAARANEFKAVDSINRSIKMVINDGN